MRNILIYFILAGVVSLSSCDGWLDVKPRSEVPEKNLFETEQGFKDALISCYIKMNDANLYGRSLTMIELEYMAQHWAVTNSNELPEWKNFNYADSRLETQIDSIYAGLYNVISQANTILINMPEKGKVISTARMRSVIEAEALAVRAYCHMDVLRFFGQVPGGVKKVSLPYAETVSTQTIPYYDFDTFVNKILTDIENAETLLSGSEPLMQPSHEEPDRWYAFDEANNENEFYSYRRFRFNAYSLKGMKARLYLWAGKTQEAHSEAMELIAALQNPKQTMNLAGTADFIAEMYSLPSECIMALSNFDMKKITDALFTTSYVHQPAESIAADIFAGQSMSINNRGIYWWNMAANDGQGTIRPLSRKFLQPSSTAANKETLVRALYHEVMPLIRLSEIYLIAMETAPTLTVANTLYPVYMEARGVLVSSPDFFTTADALQTEIIREYRREFFAEGQMFYTYKRLNQNKMLWKNDRDITEDDYIVPLPLSEMKVN